MKKFLFGVLVVLTVLCVMSCNDSSDTASTTKETSEVFVPVFESGAESKAIALKGAQTQAAYEEFNKNTLTPALIGFQGTTDAKNMYTFTLFGQNIETKLTRNLIESGTTAAAQTAWGYWNVSGKNKKPNYLNMYEGVSNDGQIYLALVIDDKNTQCSFVQMFVCDVQITETVSTKSLVCVFCDNVQISNEGKTLHGDVRALQLTDDAFLFEQGSPYEWYKGGLESLKNEKSSLFSPESALVIKADWFRDNNFNGIFVYDLNGYATCQNYNLKEEGEDPYVEYKVTYGAEMPIPNWNYSIVKTGDTDDVGFIKAYIKETFDDSNASKIGAVYLAGYEGNNNVKHTDAAKQYLTNTVQKEDEPPTYMTMYSYITDKNSANAALQELHKSWTLL